MASKREETLPAKRSTPSNEVPDFLRDLDLPSAVGFEQMKGEDQLLPRLQIAQALSPQINKRDPLHIYDLEIGHLFNSVSGQIYGEEVVFVPLFFFHSSINIQDNKIICMSKDAKNCPKYGTCKCETWGSGEALKDRKPECQLLYNYVAIIPGRNDVVVITLKSTGIKVAKRWNSLQKMLTTASKNGQLVRLPMFTRQYKATTTPAKNAAGQEFFQWVIADAGWAPVEIVKEAGPLVDSLRGRVVVDAAGLSSDGVSEGEEY